jgi:hypothetical protein
MPVASAAGAGIVSSARTIQAGGKGSSSRGNSRNSADSQPEWVPWLPEARAALLAVLVHEHEGSALQGIQHAVQLLSQTATQARAAWVEQRQQQSGQGQQNSKAAAGKQQKQQKQQPGKAAGGKQASKGARNAGSSSADVSAVNYTALLSLPVLKALLAACNDAVTDEGGEVVNEAAALAAGNAVADLMSQLLGCSLLQMLDQQTQQGPAAAPGTRNALPALVTPDAEAWALLVQLFGAAGRFKWVAGIVSAAIRGQLPLAGSNHLSAAAAAGASGTWSASELQCVLAAAADEWLAARCPGLVLAMLDVLAAAGGSSLDNARLAAAVNAATTAGVSAESASADVCLCCQLKLQAMLLLL